MRYFGTDGIRAPVGSELLSKRFVTALGVALRHWLLRNGADHPTKVVLGRDTRASGRDLESWLLNGLRDSRIDLIRAGEVPTPVVVSAAMEPDVELGIILTASHNPASDNGIKLCDGAGRKLSDEAEGEIEDRIDAALSTELPGGDGYHGTTRDLVPRYMRSLLRDLPGDTLTGLRVVLDCANGATATTSPKALAALGAELEVIGASPDGTNINDACGSEHTEALSLRVQETGADLGLAHDGDGDRLVVVDETGIAIPGECVLAALAQNLFDTGRLIPPVLVTTVMSNLGLDAMLRRQGIRVERTPVGDRFVGAAMRQLKARVGGENSGHYILADYLPSGDGLATAIELLRFLKSNNMKPSDLRRTLTLFPQLRLNLAVEAKPKLESFPELQSRLLAMEEHLGQRGRLLLRYSGTENKIRLLVEAENEKLCGEVMEDLQVLVAGFVPLA